MSKPKSDQLKTVEVWFNVWKPSDLGPALELVTGNFKFLFVMEGTGERHSFDTTAYKKIHAEMNDDLKTDLKVIRTVLVILHLYTYFL